MILKYRNSLMLALAAALLGPGPALAQSPEALARRIASISAIAVDEYALGVVDGQVVSAAELEEARLFLTEAARLAGDLPPAARPEAARHTGELLAAVARLDPSAVLAARVDSLRAMLATRLAINLDPPPPGPVALARGEAVYRASCAGCHGMAGAGDGPAAGVLDPPPSDFTDRTALSASSPLDFFRKINVGIAGTAMAGFEQELSLDDRWAVALYVSGQRYTDGERAEGRRWLVARCAACLVDLSDLTANLGVSDDSLATGLGGVVGEEVPLPAVAFARTAGAREVLGANRALAARRVAARTAVLLDDAVARARAGDRETAIGTALEAYLVFERIETDVGARDGRAAAAVERAFGDFRAALASGDSARVAATQAAVHGALERAVGVLDRGGSRTVLFGQSLVIMLREGLEAILILGALAGLLVQAGARARLRDLGLGVGLAIVASVITAGLFATVLHVSVAQQEAIEGITMLLASIVLFTVASWMVSRIEAERWRAFVGQQMRRALAGRSTLALVGVAFLAVYREGVETILFYAALLGTAEGPAGTGAVIAGFVAGVLALVAIYWAMRRWGLRIPIRPFFAVTGILLTIMAVSFAGQGVAELQVAGWIPSTPLRVPTLPALGVFPTVQTLGTQAAVAVAFLVAVWWTARPGVRPLGAS